MEFAGLRLEWECSIDSKLSESRARSISWVSLSKLAVGISPISLCIYALIWCSFKYMIFHFRVRLKSVPKYGIRDQSHSFAKFPWILYLISFSNIVDVEETMWVLLGLVQFMFSINFCYSRIESDSTDGFWKNSHNF